MDKTLAMGKKIVELQDEDDGGCDSKGYGRAVEASRQPSAIRNQGSEIRDREQVSGSGVEEDE